MCSALRVCTNYECAVGSSEAQKLRSKARSKKREARPGWLASVGLAETGPAVDPDRLPSFAAAPVKAVAVAASFPGAAHGHRVPGLQGFLRRHPAVAVPVHVLGRDAGGERQSRVPGPA